MISYFLLFQNSRSSHGAAEQMFYLTEALVLLSLCSPHISTSDKGRASQNSATTRSSLTFEPKRLDFKVPMRLNKSHNESRLKNFILSWLRLFRWWRSNVEGTFSCGLGHDNHYKRFDKLLRGHVYFNDVAEWNFQNVLCNFPNFRRIRKDVKEVLV